MKKLLILLIFAATFTTLKAQLRSVNLEITMLSPIENDFVGNGKPMDISVKVVNLGPNNMTDKDTVIFTVRFDGDTFINGGQPLSKGFLISPGLSVNQSLSWTLWGGLIKNNYNNGGTHVWCLDGRLQNRSSTVGSSDPNYTNNSSCHDVLVNIFNNGINDDKDPGKGSRVISVSPAPCSGTAHLSYFISENSDVKVTVTDMLGRTIMNVRNEFLTSGSYGNDIDVSLLAPGIYTARLNINGQAYTTKFIKQ